jgi:hypothetical protein
MNYRSCVGTLQLMIPRVRHTDKRSDERTGTSTGGMRDRMSYEAAPGATERRLFFITVSAAVVAAAVGLIVLLVR